MPRETVEALMKTEPGVKLAQYLSDTIDSLDRATDITASDPELVAIEVKARALAATKLMDVLSTLLEGMENRATMGKKVEDDYSMQI